MAKRRVKRQRSAVARSAASVRLPQRRRDAHKGDFGRVLVVGGSRGMIGAPALATNAALRSGAGLVTIACPASIQLTVAGLCPCATSLPLPEDINGRIDFRAAVRELKREKFLTNRSAATVLAIGPGLGRGSARCDAYLTALMEAFAAVGLPMVIDADALNALPELDLDSAKDSRTVKSKRRGARRVPRLGRAVLTPHPGEMARLMGLTTRAVQANRSGIVFSAQQLLAQDGAEAVIVLKGAGTLIADGRRVETNRTGNPGMATGGSGDVLTGVIAGLIAQGLSLFDAARLGAQVHGHAGDLAAREKGELSMIATDIIEQLPNAFGTARS